MSIHPYWDHHWFVWLPRHPKFESVEIIPIDTLANPYRLVWIFFTQRERNKQQLHFIDDRRIVERFEGSHYRDIAYRRTGETGLGQSVRAALTGLDGVAIEIAIDVGDRPLTRLGAGLTDQSGHSADEHLPLFHRDRNALAMRNTVLIDGEDFSFRDGNDPKGTYRFVAAYSSGIQLAVFPFHRWSILARGARLEDSSSDLSFAVSAKGLNTSLEAGLPGYRNYLTIGLDATGALTGYRHDAASHRLVITLDQALPLAGDAPRAFGAFSIHWIPGNPSPTAKWFRSPCRPGADFPGGFSRRAGRSSTLSSPSSKPAVAKSL